MLRRKRPRTVEEADRVISDPERSRRRTMERAVRLLAAKARSIAELRTRLLEKNYTNAEIVDSVIDRLREYGYLNDEQYAADTALSKLRQKPQGRRRLERVMSQRQLDADTISAAIDTAYEKLPEEELIDLAIQKRIRLRGRPETRDDTKKFLDHLLRQGFNYDLIRAKMRHLADVDE